MRFDIGPQIPEAFTRMMASAQVKHITEGGLDGVGARTIGRQPEQGEPRVGSQSRRHSLGVMNGTDFSVLCSLPGCMRPPGETPMKVLMTEGFLVTRPRASKPC